MNISNYKKVSIVMCTYNGELYIEEQLNTILSQTYPIYEIVIADDCSKDNTYKIIETYAQSNKAIKYYKNETHLNVNESFRRVCSMATGEYIVPCDQDDIWFAQKIEKLVSAIERDSEKLLVLSQNQILFEDGSIDYTFNLFYPYRPLPLLFFGNVGSANALLFSRKLLEYIKKWNFPLELGTDWRITLIAYAMKKEIIIDEVLMIWRRHSEVCTQAISKTHDTKKILNPEFTNKQKFLSAIKLLIKNNKNTRLQNQFNAISDLIFEVENCKIWSRYCKLIAKQTLFSFVLAGIIAGLNSTKFQITQKSSTGILYKLRLFSFAFRYHFVYYYDSFRK